MKILSIFDGISCARVALERAGIPVEVYYASEVDKYAIQISQKNWPDIKQIGDVKVVNTIKEVIGNHIVDVIDLLIGGSPCQDLSIAKKNRKGLDGERSGLFWEYVRILNEVKPKYFILENVASMPKEAKELITRTLGVEPVMIDAALVSAQRRKRLFWVGKLDEFGTYKTVVIPQPEDRGIFLKDILENISTSPNGLEIKTKSKTLRLGGRGSNVGDKHEWDSVYQYRRTYWRETKGGKVPTLTANMGTGGHNVPFVQALTEVRTEEAKKLRSEHMKKTGKDFSPRRAKELVPRTDGKVNTLTTGMTKEHYILQTARGYNDGGKKFDKVPTLSSSSWEHNHKLDGIRKLTTTECERLQGLPDGYTEGVSNTQRYKALGNAFNVDVVAHILKHLV